MGEVKDRFDDALCATYCAVEEGIVPGGGTALLRCLPALENLNLENFDQNIGVGIVRNAIKQPIMTIVKNAGEEGAVVVETLLRRSEEAPNLGYDAAKGEYVDVMQAGIIDTAKVIKTALSDAASVASLLVTTEVTITEELKSSQRKLNPYEAAGRKQDDWKRTSLKA